MPLTLARQKSLKSRASADQPSGGTAYHGRKMSIPKPGKPVRGSRSGVPLMALFDLLGKRWAMGVIWQLRHGPATFRALQSVCETISPAVLNSRLKELREARLVCVTDEGYALTEDFPLKDCVPQAKFGTLGLMRADQIPDIHAIYVEKEELLPFAYGAKGIGEIATIPTAPAVQGAYYARDHILRTSLPMQDTFYKKPAKKAAP